MLPYSNAELIDSYECFTYKIIFGQMQNLRNYIQTNAELTKITERFGQMHAPQIIDVS